MRVESERIAHTLVVYKSYIVPCFFFPLDTAFCWSIMRVRHLAKNLGLLDPAFITTFLDFHASV